MLEDNDDNNVWRKAMDRDLISLSERIAGVEVGIKSISNSVLHLSESIDKVVERQRESAKTQWPIIFSSLTVVLLLLGGFLNGYIRDLSRVEGAVETIRNNRISFADPVQNALIELNTNSLSALKVRLTSVLKNDATIGEKVASMEPRVDKIEEKQYNVLKRISAHHAQIEGLERQIFGDHGAAVGSHLLKNNKHE